MASPSSWRIMPKQQENNFTPKPTVSTVGISIACIMGTATEKDQVTADEKFVRLLRQNKLKVTQPRLGVLKIISEKETAISQPELERMLGDAVDRVTLYRVLATFEEKGILHKIFDLHGTATYALCSTACDEHHHHDEHVHFICSSCNNIYCLDDIKLPKINLPEGYQLQSVGINAVGLCAECKAHK
ncbi:Fur family transcriptional regulator, ferric uptake regulator [Parapedobacter indicus]|uniref:Fur family transcriptional regulator, ferric uptake regulator n=3 Tax=Parapedobacter indicus TaxID=1477437 RepID=A0A1I3SP24_9SPHI|nr:Fur family ferric uptake transcriptional regulator [Parapedobacter indicus]SFJ60508.1 Fur family transcriptional regulator, ferric uptake regulator [Parapedobacter indicus]